jgi:hypothetical protein
METDAHSRALLNIYFVVSSKGVVSGLLSGVLEDSGLAGYGAVSETLPSIETSRTSDAVMQLHSPQHLNPQVLFCSLSLSSLILRTSLAQSLCD